MKRSRRLVWIGSARWKIIRCRVPSDRYGDCDYATRTIRISSALHGDDLLNVILHEWMHARWQDHTEESVLEAADQLSGYLRAVGFRMEGDHEED